MLPNSSFVRGGSMSAKRDLEKATWLLRFFFPRSSGGGGEGKHSAARSSLGSVGNREVNLRRMG